MRKHNSKHTKQVQCKCTVCNKVFSSAVKAKSHLTIHDKEGKEANFQENVIMKQPMLETANGLLQVAAPRPKVPYADLDEYKNRPFRCYICSAAFNKTVHLRRHLLRHTGEKKFKCDYCPK